MRTGVVGAGFMGRSFANLLCYHPNMTRAGVADGLVALRAVVAADKSAPTGQPVTLPAVVNHA